MAAAAERRSLSTKPLPKLELAFSYLAAFGIGLVPYALLIKSLPIALGLAVIAVFTFVVATWSRREFAGETPSVQELAFAMLGRCAAGATVGIIGIGIFYGVRGIRSLLALGAGGGPDLWSLYSSAVIVALFVAAAISNDVVDIMNALYPDRPGQRSPFFPLSTQTRQLGWSLVAAAVGVAVVAATTYFEGYAGYFVAAVILLNFTLVFIGAEYLEPKTLDSVRGASDSAIAAIKPLLEAAGYSVIPRPRTGNAEADSVISILDFLAIRRESAIAGRVSAGAQQSDQVLRHEAASLEPAVWMLEDQLRKQQSAKISLKPILLVLGGDAKTSDDARLSDTPAARSFQIVRGPSEAELMKMIASEDQRPLKTTAARLFGSSASPATGAA